MQINMPSCYIQEKNAISKISQYLSWLRNEKVLIIMDEFTYNNFNVQVIEGLNRDRVEYIIEQFSGECCNENIDKLCEAAKVYEAKSIIGIGGGKVLDVAKVVAHCNSAKTIIVPTAASTDGPCSKISVLYEKDGKFKKYIELNRNPEAVIVDLDIIVNAPIRLFKAGIGDALATYFETEAGYEGQVEANGKSRMSITARVVSKQCYDIIMAYGYEAVRAVEEKVINEAVEAVVEAIIFLSCIGFENGSLGAAHAVANALSDGNNKCDLLHGEKVAFGTIVQILLQKKCGKSLIDVIKLSKKIGLPTSISDVGLDADNLQEFIEKLCEEGQPMYNMKREYCNYDNISAAMRYTSNLE